MLVGLLYAALLLASSALAFRLGGSVEKWGAAITVTASAATIASAPIATRFAAANAGLFAIDLAVVVGFVTLARLSIKFWPIWAGALALLCLWADVVRVVHPASRAIAYAFNEQAWSWPILVLIVVMSARHRSWSRRNDGDL
jgi:hypothetical protein